MDICRFVHFDLDLLHLNYFWFAFCPVLQHIIPKLSSRYFFVKHFVNILQAPPLHFGNAEVCK